MKICYVLILILYVLNKVSSEEVHESNGKGASSDYEQAQNQTDEPIDSAEESQYVGMPENKPPGDYSQGDYYVGEQDKGTDQLGYANDNYIDDYDNEEPQYDDTQSDATVGEGDGYADHDDGFNYDYDLNMDGITSPFLAAVHSPTATCSGVIIDREWILTAAQCITDTHAELIQCYLATKDLRNSPHITARAKEIFINPHYSGRGGILNDIALIRLTEPLVFSRNVTRLALSDENNNAGDCVLFGYGEDVDVVVNMNIQIQSGCVCLGPDMFLCAPGPVRHSQCIGDRGGPLVCSNQLVGIFVGPYEEVYCKNVHQFEGNSRRIYLKRNLKSIKKLSRIYDKNTKSKKNSEIIRNRRSHRKRSVRESVEIPKNEDVGEDIPNNDVPDEEDIYKSYDNKDEGSYEAQHEEHNIGGYDYNDDDYLNSQDSYGSTDTCLGRNEFWVFVYAKTYKDWLIQVTGSDILETDPAAYYSSDQQLRSAASTSPALYSITIITLLFGHFLRKLKP